MTQRMDYAAATPAGVKALGEVYAHILRSGLMNAYNRLAISFRATPAAAKP